jgi:hypothetical protein
MIRLIAYPESYDPHKDDLDNYELFIMNCLKTINNFAKKMCLQFLFHIKIIKYPIQNSKDEPFQPSMKNIGYCV